MSTSMTDLTGWFQIGWNATVPPGELVSLTVLGHELVARRTVAGALVVTDAHCPHLGAHLGMGCAVGDRVRCPLHGWEWGEDGSNASIPYRDDTATSVGLRVWHSREVHGLLFLWFDVAGAPPRYEPVPPGTAFDVGLRQDALLGGPGSGSTHIGPVTVHPQLATEDRVDTYHFVGAHRTVPPTLDDFAVDGPYLSTRVTLGETSEINGTEQRSEVHSTATGVGINSLYIRTPTFTAYIVLSITPRDDQASDVFHTLWVEPVPGTDEDRLLERMLVMMRKELEADLSIWQRMRHVSLPDDPVAAQPGLIAMRAWADQFYPNGSGVV